VGRPQHPQRIPWLFEGRLPDLNIGTANGAAADASHHGGGGGCLPRRPGCQQRGQWPLQGRLHHPPLRPAGQPHHAVQLEKCQSLYMQEAAPFAYDEARAAAIQPVLQAMVGAALDAARALYAR
jgi:N-formylglutamate deformylase